MGNETGHADTSDNKIEATTTTMHTRQPMTQAMWYGPKEVFNTVTKYAKPIETKRKKMEGLLNVVVDELAKRQEYGKD